MFTFLRRFKWSSITGTEADSAVKERNEKLAALEQQGQDLEALMERMKAVQTAAKIRVKSCEEQRATLQQASRSGEYRFSFDSNPALEKP